MTTGSRHGSPQGACLADQRSSHVVATAGHVDHGKSTLVRALTGIDTDRWDEEKRRGLTIDLGFAWTTLDSGRRVAFVDVPGHERFVGNMLAGLGPVSVVMFVVAADEGWSAHSSDHRDALAAWGIDAGVLVVTRADRAPGQVEEVVARSRAELAGTGLRDAPVVAVSAVDGTGLDELRLVLDTVLAALPEPDQGGRIRLWVDRSFSVRGSGTVVTGTLATGTLAVDDELQLVAADTSRTVIVRGIESQGDRSTSLGPTSRAGVNLRGVAADQVSRGDALVTPGAWLGTAVVDVRRTAGPTYDDLAEQVLVHIGTAAVPARVRRLDPDHARVTLARSLPLAVGDRLALRDPGRAGSLGGAQVLDADPLPLTRRGDAARTAVALAATTPDGDVLAEVASRGAVEVDRLRRLGVVGSRSVAPEGIRVLGRWWIDPQTHLSWQHDLVAAVDRAHERDPLGQGVSGGALVAELGLPSPEILGELVRDAGLEQAGGHVRRPGRPTDLGPAEGSVVALESRLAGAPFDAPLADELAELRLGPPELAAAERARRVIRLGEVVLLPTAPALAMRQLAGLDQPFTTSQARQALGTSRRVAIPLLEHLDRRGWTRRVDADHREVVR